MQIPINKDLEEAYKDEAVKGFTWREAFYVLLSFILIGTVTVLLWWRLNISPDMGILIGIPCGIPTLFVGFKRYQGLTVFAYLREILFMQRTRILTYDANEIPEEKSIFYVQYERRRRKKG